MTYFTNIVLSKFSTNSFKYNIKEKKVSKLFI